MEEILHKASLVGLSASEYMRACVRGSLMDNPKFRENIAELTYEIHKIGTNINQIAYHHNMGMLTVKEKELLLELMKDVRKGVIDIVGYGNHKNNRN